MYNVPLSICIKEERKAVIRFCLPKVRYVSWILAILSITIPTTTCTLSLMVDFNGLRDLSSSHNDVLRCLKLYPFVRLASRETAVTILRSYATNNFCSFHTFRKQKANQCPPFLLDADRQWI
ncbi:hypothetical protein TNCV_91381 [Trichonephila clavipes]|nr:hypothetical protein TNCV_91381 [Trichonephila clavipes]